jgi:transposase
MAMSRRTSEVQGDLWIAVQEIVRSPGHPFYERLNALLAETGFDRLVEDRCQKFYAEVLGRPSIEPGVYFRMLLVGYFEGLDSERGIAWRCADSLALRAFLGYALTKATPDHSSLSKIRQRIDLETHEAVFAWVLKVLATHDLLKGKTLGIDATTLEANAALRSIVRRDTGESYRAFLEGLARASGIETPTQADLAKLDRKRPKKGSNKDWKNPHDPDAKITKMKDGRTHLAHKAEHAVDLDTGAIVAVTLQEADKGDTTTVYETVVQAGENRREVADDPGSGEALADGFLKEVVADKGYHSNDTLRDFAEMETRTYISEPDRGRRDWKGKPAEQAAVYANRRRIRGQRGKALLRKRGELLERPFAHCYDTGGMRRTHLRGHPKILKRLLIHVAGFNLALVMRSMLGLGTPRGLADLSAALSLLVHGLVSLHHAVFTLVDGLWSLVAGWLGRPTFRPSCVRLLPTAA